MKRAFLILSLATLVTLAAASAASAQIRIRGSGWGVSIGGGGYNPGYYGGGYYGGGGYYPGNYYRGSYYGSSPYYYSSPSYYYSTPSYYYAPSTYVEPYPTTPSYVAPANTTASLTVLLPVANAEVWFDDSLTQQQGMERLFTTPPLSGSGKYTIRARWTQDGRAVDQQRIVDVRPGQAVTVDFRREAIPQPRSPE